MGRLATSWQLTKASWSVVKQDKELLWMPFLSAIATLIVIGGLAGITWLATPDLFTADGQWSPVNTVISAVMYLLLAWVGVYFHAAAVAGAHERLSGGDPTVGSALAAANKRFGQLFLWAVMVATVNLILKYVRERGGWIGRLIAGIAGTAWNLATFFVVPRLLFTDEGVGQSLGSSGRLFKERWGETVAGHIGIGLAMSVLVFVWVLVAGALTLGLFAGLGLVGLFVGLAILVLGIILLSLVGSVMGAAYKAALYQHAVSGHSDFGGHDLGAVAY